MAENAEFVEILSCLGSHTVSSHGSEIEVNKRVGGVMVAMVPLIKVYGAARGKSSEVQVFRNLVIPFCFTDATRTLDKDMKRRLSSF